MCYGHGSEIQGNLSKPKLPCLEYTGVLLIQVN